MCRSFVKLVIGLWLVIGMPAAAVLVSPGDLESLEETVAVLGDSEAVAGLVEAHRAYLDGDVVRGVEAVRALRPR